MGFEPAHFVYSSMIGLLMIDSLLCCTNNFISLNLNFGIFLLTNIFHSAYQLFDRGVYLAPLVFELGMGISDCLIFKLKLEFSRTYFFIGSPFSRGFLGRFRWNCHQLELEFLAEFQNSECLKDSEVLSISQLAVAFGISGFLIFF